MNFFQTMVLAGALVAAGTSLGCRQAAKAKETAKEPKDQAVPVEVATVIRGSIEAAIKNSTHLEAEEEVKVYARTSNRVMELLVEEGDEVGKEQVMLRLDHASQQTAFNKAQVRLEKARQEFERQQALFQQKLISEQAFNDARFEFRQLELALEDARRELDYTEVRAPIAGTVSRRLVKKGDLVTVNQHLFDVVDFDSIVARIYVPEKHLRELELNLPARVRPIAVTGEAITGYLKRIAPVVESKSGTVKLTVGFKDVQFLRPGMYVNVELVTDQRTDAILINQRALVPDGEGSYVFRLLPDRVVERVMVETRISDRFNVEPTGGFKEGDQIVVAGQTGLKHGAKVRLPGDPAGEEKKEKTEQAEESMPQKKS